MPALKPALDRSPSRHLVLPLWLCIGACFACLSLGAFVARQLASDADALEKTSFRPNSAVTTVFYEPYRAASGLPCRLIGSEYCDVQELAIETIELVPDTHWTSYAVYPDDDERVEIEFTYDPYWPSAYVRYEVCSEAWGPLDADRAPPCYRGAYRLNDF